jgi:uncharacterized membrane protein
MYRLFKNLIHVKYLDVTLSLVVSTFIHTLLVLIPFYFFGRSQLAEVGFTGNMFTLIIGVVASNGMIEMLLAGLIGGPIAQRLVDYKESVSDL